MPLSPYNGIFCCKSDFVRMEHMEKRRFNEIDVMRIIGFFMVVDQHILGAYAQRPETSFGDSMVLHLLYLLGRPAVPMFVAITGFTLFYANYNRIHVLDFYKKRFATIVMPYMFWSFTSILIFKKYDMFNNLALVLATGNASYHLWYMAMSIRLYLWFPIILVMMSWIIKRTTMIQRSIFALLFISYWALLKKNNYLVDQLAIFFFNTPSLLEKRLIQYSPIFWSIYFVCGIVVCLKYEFFKELVLKYSKMIVATYIPLASYMFYTQICNKLPEYYPRIAYEHLLYILYMIQTIVIIYIIAVKISKKAERFKEQLAELGSLSYGAYLIHVIVLQKIAPILRKEIPFESYLASGILIFITTCSLSFALCYIIRFFPLSRYIIGVKRVPIRFIKIEKHHGIDM